LPYDLPDLRRRGAHGLLGLAAACAGALAITAAPAAAQSGGGATADPSGKLTDPAASGSNKASGAKLPTLAVPPKPLLITCRMGCAGLDLVRAGGVARVSGDAMDGARTIIFKGGKGAGDDVSGPAIPATTDAVDVVVPAAAVSGPVQVLDADGAASRTTGKMITVIGANRASSASASPDARLDSTKVFFRGAHAATLSVFVPEGLPRHVVIDLLRTSDKVSVGHWELDALGGTVQSVTWNGVVGGTVQKDGRYRFQISAPAPGASIAQSGEPLDPAFTFLGNIFPIRGKHDFGGGEARFGAGRAGHIHQGQDTFAACGTPLVAARGGKVKFRGSESDAGNYIVIDGAGTGTDYVYMHLKDPALAKKGETVYTGQPIGEVGDTGDAVGCHLHMELWKAPGWYTGGEPLDPLPSLQRWDKQS
jgi:hypothetical protein